MQPHIACLVLAETRSPEALVASVRREHTLMPSVAHAHMKATFGEVDPEDDEHLALAQGFPSRGGGLRASTAALR